MKKLAKFFKALRGGFFFQYFLSYVCVLAIPLLLSFFIYSSSAKIISSQCSAQAIGLLNQLKVVTDSSLNELKSISLALRSSETLQDFQEAWNQRDNGGEEIFGHTRQASPFPYTA